MIIDLIENGIYEAGATLDELLSEAWFFADRAQHRGAVTNAGYFDFCAEVPRPSSCPVYTF